MDDESNRDEGIRASALSATVGWLIAGNLLGGLFVGYVAGNYFGWNPGATIIGLFVGIVGALYKLARVTWWRP